jgi:hypothetical protein
MISIFDLWWKVNVVFEIHLHLKYQQDYFSVLKRSSPRVVLFLVVIHQPAPSFFFSLLHHTNISIGWVRKETEKLSLFSLCKQEE